MKRIFTFIAAGLICSLGYGQTEQKIHKSDGSILQLPLSGIDSINFSVSPPASLHIHQEGSSTESILLDNIDSVTYVGTDWGQPMLIPLAGQVSDEDGQPVPGAVIRAGSLTVTSDANGVFYFPSAPVSERLGYVTASKTGFFQGSRTFLPTEGTNRVEIRLLRKNAAGTFQVASGGTVQAEGVSITFTGGSFVQNGTAFNGQVNVTLNYIDPESGHFNSEMPGNLLGIINGNSRYLTSYGMLAAELADNAGNTVELASGTTAQIRFPLSSTLQADAPAEIDLWYFDEVAGLWMHEGSATRQGNDYVAAVSHFSFWNCDIPSDFILLNGQVTDTSGTGMVGAKVTISSPSRGSSTDYTGSIGHFGGYVPSGETLTLTVSIRCGTTGVYQEVYTTSGGPFSVSTVLPPIQVEQGTLTLVSGTVTDCNNAALSNGYVVANGQAYFPGAGGNFSFLACGNSLTIQAYSSEPWAAGNPLTINLSGNTANVDAMRVCGVAGGTVTDIDGNQYPTVIIGTQEWMQENLKTTKFADGSIIPNVTENNAWVQLSTPAWCNYDNNAFQGSMYGKLYNWYTVTDSHGLCPAGWHVPTDAEWTTLTDYLGGLGIAGGKMKTVTGWNSPNTGATNTSGFSGLPGGFRSNDSGSFVSIDIYGYWWSSTDDNGFAWAFGLRNTSNAAFGYATNKEIGSSVRCLKD